MKRFLNFVSRLLFIVVAAVAVEFILLGILVIRVDDLATQVAVLSTRVHGLRRRTPPGPTNAPSPTGTPRPTRMPTPTRTATATPVPTPYFIVNSDWVNVRKGPSSERVLVRGPGSGGQVQVQSLDGPSRGRHRAPRAGFLPQHADAVHRAGGGATAAAGPGQQRGGLQQ